MLRERLNILRADWQLLMASWIISWTDTGSPTPFFCVRPLSWFAVYRGVYHWKREVIYMGQQDKRSSRPGLWNVCRKEAVEYSYNGGVGRFFV